MADGVSSPLTFRDFIRHLLPTATALCLFLPFLRVPQNKFEVAAVVFASVVLGYLVTTPLNTFLAAYYSCTPIMKVFTRRRRWMAANWDYDKLFYSLTQEEREYIYVTQGYLELYRQLSFYLLIYALANLFLILNAVRAAFDVSSFFLTAVDARTSVVGGLLVPTWLLLFLSLILAHYSFKDFLNEFAILFHDDGQYSTFAKRIHEKEGGFARAIFGVVRSKKEGNSKQQDVLSAVKVTLQDASGKERASMQTDLDGYFQFDNRKNEYPPGDYKLLIDGKEPRTISLADKVVPLFTIDSSVTSVDQPKLERTRSLMILTVIIVPILILILFAQPDWRLRTLYVLSILPYVAFIYTFFWKPTRLDSPILSASFILSVGLAVTGLLNSITTFAALDTNKASRWTNLVLPFLSQRWYDIAILILIMFLLCLVHLIEFKQSVSSFKKVSRLPRLNGITVEPTPIVDPLADQEYVISVTGEDLQDVSLIEPENGAGKINVLTQETEVNEAGTVAKIHVKVSSGNSEGVYELPVRVEIPKVSFIVAAQPPPESLTLSYGADEKGNPPVVKAAQQEVRIVICGKHLNGATLTPSPPLSISDVTSTSTEELQAIVTIPAGTTAADYSIGVKNTNAQGASIKFTIRPNG